MSKFMDFAMLHYAIFLIFYLLPLNVLSQLSPINVTLGSSLTADNNGNNSWTSPSGEFAFGFIQSPGTGRPGYLLAIWFNKIPEKTVIWSANRDNLAQQGSRLQLFKDGRFVLNDPTGKSIWEWDDANNTVGTGVAYGVMLDTGNFVLVSNTGSTLWQSFDTPTDTLLPSQKLITNGIIVPNLSGTNYSSGKFHLRMQSDGNLVLYTRKYPLPDQNSPYWSTETFGNDFQLVFNQSGPIFVVAQNGTLMSSVFSNTVLSNQNYQRLTLDYDGVLRHYVYPKSSSSTGGWLVFEFLPHNICLSINEDTGGGVCGYNSLCSIGNDQKPACKCPPGYSLIVPNDSMSGCKPDFVPQSCDNDLNDTANFGYNYIPNAHWPGNDFEKFQPVTEDWCRQVCLSDCFCAVAVFTYDDNTCFKKRFPLSNGRIDPSNIGKGWIKVRLRNSTTMMSSSPPTDTSTTSRSNHNNKKVNSIVLIVGSALLGTSVLANILLLLCKNSDNTPRAMPAAAANYPGLNIRSFSYNELEEATNGFKEELGRGAFSVVYKGTLQHDDGGTKLVAVKQLRNIEKQSDNEFNAEVSSISRTNHKNLVQLLGYCNEGQHRLLMYEYMCNGSLANYLFVDNPRPNWYKRVEIAITTARGLSYLHEECSSHIIHCDIKPQNVLLDQSLTAKISDFGLAKLLKQDQTKTMTGIRGTRGYVAPEWFRNTAITSKVDVYSFGVLLLEIICCRKNIDTSVGDEKEVILTDWVYDCYEEQKLNLLIKDDEGAQNDMNRVERFVSIAIWCIQEDPSLRPTMKGVVQMLEGSIMVSVPPTPSSFITSIN